MRRFLGLVAVGMALLIAPPAAAEPRGRDVTYRMTSAGLIIEVEGVILEPKASPQKTPKGWIVALSVRATVKDQHSHKLLSPDQGPLMVAAEVARGGKTAHVGDERKGDAETILNAGEATTLDRKVEIPIATGQTLTLNVGLWGLGRDAEERRPVKKLFVVKMVAGGKKPLPVITPPD